MRQSASKILCTVNTACLALRTYKSTVGIWAKMPGGCHSHHHPSQQNLPSLPRDKPRRATTARGGIEHELTFAAQSNHCTCAHQDGRSCLCRASFSSNILVDNGYTFHTVSPSSTKPENQHRWASSMHLPIKYQTQTLKRSKCDHESQY